MAVRIRLKKIGRKARPFFRFCAVDAREPRDGKVIEELGYYDPMVRETDARVVLKAERVDYWLSVGAQPSDKVAVLIKKYGSNGTHLEEQKAAQARMKTRPVQFQPSPAPAAAAQAPAADEAAPAADAAPTEEAAPAADAAPAEGQE